MHQIQRLGFTGAALLAVLVLDSSPAQATKYWKNSVVAGNWNTGNNWSGVSAASADNGGVPVVLEAVNIVFTDGTARTVTYDVSAPVLGLLSIDLTGGGATTSTLSLPNNNSLTASGILVGGHSGVAQTAGRGALNQSAGTVTTNPGTDFVVGYGANSTGVYTLSGGALVAKQAEYIGFNGTGTFTHSGGSNTINASASGILSLGRNAGSNGTYNLSGSGTLVANADQHIGQSGTGIFNQTGGTNTIAAGKNLYVGSGASGTGIYNLSGGGTVTAPAVIVGNANTGVNSNFLITGAGSRVNATSFEVGRAGRGVLTLADGGILAVDSGSQPLLVATLAGSYGAVNIGNDGAPGVLQASEVRFGAGTGQLYFNHSDNLTFATPITGAGSVSKTGPGTTTLSATNSYTGVTQLSGGTLAISSDGNLGMSPGPFNSDQLRFFGGTLRATQSFAMHVYRGMEFNGIGGTIEVDATMTLTYPNDLEHNAGTMTKTGAGTLSLPSLSINEAALVVTGGGILATTIDSIIAGSTGTATVRGAGSTWNVGDNLDLGGLGFGGTLDIEDQALVHVADVLFIGSSSTVNLSGGTLRFNRYSRFGTFNFNSGTIQVAFDRSVGTDAAIADLFGAAPIISTGKGLSIEGIATLTKPITVDGGTFTVAGLVNGSNLRMDRGTLNITNQALTIGAGGLLGGTLDLAGDVTINVTLGIQNRGLVTGDGQLGGTFANAIGGELRAEPGHSLKLTGSGNANSGQINLLGGLVEFTQNLTNSAGGFISGNGTLIVRNGLLNNGTMNFSGTANILGDTTNSAGGKIISAGGGPTTFFDNVTNQGEIRTSAGSFTVFFGSVAGAGTFTGLGTVNFEGDLKPGNSAAAVQFAGDVAFGSDAALQIELGGIVLGTQYDHVRVAGDLSLDGSLILSLIDNFQPTSGQSFNILDWLGTRTGTFSSLTLPALAGLTWNTSQLYTTGVLSLAAAGLPGDYNQNGTVDAADYTVWRDNLGSGTALPNDDSPGVDFDDYTRWKANFGETAGSGLGAIVNAAVPEPSSLAMCVAVLVIAAAVGSRKSCGARLRLSATLSALAVVLAAPAASFGQTLWTADTGDWFEPSNWTLGVPNDPGDAIIGNGGTAQLQAPGGSVRRLRVGVVGGTGNLLVDSGTLVVTDDLHLNEGSAGPASMIVRNGSTVTAPDTVVGFNSAANTSFLISGAGTVYNASNDFTVGGLGAGTASLTVDGGAVLASGTSSIGVGASGNGTVDGAGSRWSSTGAFTVGSAGLLTIQNQGTVHVGTTLSIASFSDVILSGGTLRFDAVGGSAGLNQLFYSSGTIQLAGNRNFLSPADAITTLFGSTPTISSGKALTIEGSAFIVATTVRVNGGTLTSLNSLQVGNSGTSLLEITNGGTVSNIDGVIEGSTTNPQSHVIVSGTGSTWNNSGNLRVGEDSGSNPTNSLTVNTGATVFVGQSLEIVKASLNLQGGTIRFDGYSRDVTGQINFGSGTVQLAGDRNVGTDAAIADFFGAPPTISTGKSLVVEGTAALAASVPVTLSGGTLSAERVLMTAGSRLVTSLPSTALGPVLALAGSVIDATGANLTLGDATKVNGFYGNGTIDVGPSAVTLADSNDAVLDSASLVTLGAGSSPGTLTAANGLTLDFGGNVTGFGTLSTPNILAKPIINNGHIIGDSVAQPITLPGYVKGVGTFDNVNFTGTFSPGLSPTSLIVGNIAFSPSSTLFMELGGTSPGTGYDQILSSAAPAFDGILQVSLINGFSPAAGQSFNLFDWISTSGTFDTLQLPTLAGLTWNTSQLYTAGVLSLAAAGLPGDYNQNGTVDAADYTLWRDNLGSTTSLPNDDTAGVGPDDYTRWKANFGETAGSGSGATANPFAIASSNIPEPASLLLLMIGCAAIGLLKQSRCRN